MINRVLAGIFLVLFSLLANAAPGGTYATYSAAMSQCMADVSNYYTGQYAGGTCIVSGCGFIYFALNGNVYNGDWYKYPCTTCTAGSVGPSGHLRFGSLTDSGAKTCGDDGCQYTFTEAPGTKVDTCFSIDPTLNAQNNIFGTGQLCFQDGSLVGTGQTCKGASDSRSGPDAPPPDPSHCQQPKFANGQVPPAASAVCFKTDLKEFCTSDGKYCAFALDHPTSGGGGPSGTGYGSGGSCALDPTRPCTDPPSSSCSDDPTGALCVGNPPPTPDPPPAGPGGNCTGGTTSWMVNAWPDQASAMENCPPPTTSCPAGTSMVNGQCTSGCPDGQAMINGQCGQQCPAGQTVQNGSCNYVCPPGQSLNDNRCVSNTQCPSGTTPQNGVCIGQCPTGQVNNGNGCVSACGAGTSWSNGGCVATCPSGSTKDANGICQPTTCPTGQVKSNGQCVTQCAANQHQDGTRCVDNNAASGGTDCTAPPVCTGDQALCNIDYQAWSARCAAQPGTGSTADLSSGAIYTQTGDSVSGVMGKYMTQIKAAPLVHAADNFFTVNVSGSCPQLSIPAGTFMGTNIWQGLDGNFLCSGTVETIMGLASYVLLALASFQAFRIALY